MENKQTAVEWLVEALNNNQMIKQNEGQIANNVLPDIIQRAKQMEKDRLFHSFYAGAGIEDNEEYYDAFEQYYNETYYATQLPS